VSINIINKMTFEREISIFKIVNPSQPKKVENKELEQILNANPCQT